MYLYHVNSSLLHSDDLMGGWVGSAVRLHELDGAARMLTSLFCLTIQLVVCMLVYAQKHEANQRHLDISGNIMLYLEPGGQKG